MPTRRLFRLRNVLIALAIVVLLPVVAVAVVLATLDLNAYKPRIAQAVHNATGRELALNGPIGLKLSLTPTLELRDVAFANMPSGSRPQMATMERLQIELALIPLLSRQVAIERLVLVKPDILLETDAQGTPNWRFQPGDVAAKETPTQAPAPATEKGLAKFGVRIGSVRLLEGAAAYRDGVTGRSEKLDIAQFEARSRSTDSPLDLRLEAAYNGHPLGLQGEVGALQRLTDPAATSPWPIKLTVTAADAHVVADGAIERPMEGRGYHFKIDGAVPDVSHLAPFAEGVPLPPLRDVSFSADIADSGQPIPALGAARIAVGASDLGAIAEGLRIQQLEIVVPKATEPVRIAFDGSRAKSPIKLAGTLGPLAALLPDAKAGQPWPIDINAEAGGATAAIKGAVADARDLSGVAVGVSVHIPDLAALSPLAGTRLPKLRGISFGMEVAENGNRFSRGAFLRQIRLALPQADLAGDITAAMGDRPRIEAQLSSRRIDVDGLVAALPSSSGQSPVKSAAQPERGKTRLFSDDELPLAQLQAADANLRLTVGELVFGGVQYRNLVTVLALERGKLQLDPMTAQLPGGRMEMRATVDATEKAPPVTLTVKAPALALQPLLAAYGQAGALTGTVELDVDLKGAGRSPHAIASTLSGYIGVAMANGDFDSRLADLLGGNLLRAANIKLDTGGRSNIRCIAVRFDARAGNAQARALLADTSLATLDGSGTVNLRDETLALLLRPALKIGVGIPVIVKGPLTSPGYEVDPAGAAAGAAGAAAAAAAGAASAAESGAADALGAIAGGSNPLKALSGNSGQSSSGSKGDKCAQALAVARGGRQGASPAAEQPQQRPAQPGRPQPPAKPSGIFSNFPSLR